MKVLQHQQQKFQATIDNILLHAYQREQIVKKNVNVEKIENLKQNGELDSKTPF